MPKETTDEAVARVRASRVLDHADPNPPAGATPIAVVRMKRGRGMRKDDGIVLVDWEERALAARFIRLIRSNYWLSHFVKHLLRLDSQSPDMVPIATVKEQLDQQESLEELVKRLQYIGKTGWWADHPVFAAIREEWGDEGYQYRGDKMIRDLIESAAKAKAVVK